MGGGLGTQAPLKSHIRPKQVTQKLLERSPLQAGASCVLDLRLPNGPRASPPRPSAEPQPARCLRVKAMLSWDAHVVILGLLIFLSFSVSSSVWVLFLSNPQRTRSNHGFRVWAPMGRISVLLPNGQAKHPGNSCTGGLAETTGQK